MRIPHPPIIEVALATGESLDKWAHRLPGTPAQARRTKPTLRDEGLPHPDVTRVLHRVLEAFHEVTIDRLPHSRDAHVPHGGIVIDVVHSAKVIKIP